jgi:hypothetical protein
MSTEFETEWLEGINIEDLVIDPACRTTIDKAREYNANPNAFENVEPSDYVNELDQEWPQLEDTMVVISGRIMFQQVEDGEVQNRDFETIVNTRAISRGFGTLQIADSTDNLAYAIEKIGLLFLRMEDDGEGGYSTTPGIILPEDLTLLEVPYRPSMKAAEARLKYHSPHLFSELENRLEPIDTADECRQVMALQDFIWDLDTTGDEDAQRIGSAIREYVNGWIDFDKRVPYRISVTGSGYELNDDADLDVVDTMFNDEIFEVNAIVFMQIPGDPVDSSVVIPFIHVYHASDLKNAVPRPLFVPIINIRDIISIRQKHYETRAGEEPSGI